VVTTTKTKEKEYSMLLRNLLDTSSSFFTHNNVRSVYCSEELIQLPLGANLLQYLRKKRTAKVKDFNSRQVDLAKSTFFLTCDVHVHRAFKVFDDMI
jgi:hypothetical protein